MGLQDSGFGVAACRRCASVCHKKLWMQLSDAEVKQLIIKLL